MEILIAIVLVGILSAVVVVGIGRMTDTASASSCATSADAARTAVNSYFVDRGTYPKVFADLTAPATDGAGAPLTLPNNAKVTDSLVTAGGWTLAMSSTTPPTFTCGTAGATSTTAAPTTAAPTTAAPTTVAPANNGVSVAASTGGDKMFYGEDILSMTNSSAVSAMTITITVAQTTGVTAHGQYTDFWGGVVTSSNATSGGKIRYTFTVTSNQPIVPGTWKIVAQYDGTGTAHATAGDTWSVTTTSKNTTVTLTGSF